MSHWWETHQSCERCSREATYLGYAGGIMIERLCPDHAQLRVCRTAGAALKSYAREQCALRGFTLWWSLPWWKRVWKELRQR